MHNVRGPVLRLFQRSRACGTVNKVISIPPGRAAKTTARWKSRPDRSGRYNSPQVALAPVATTSGGHEVRPSNRRSRALTPWAFPFPPLRTHANRKPQVSGHREQVTGDGKGSRPAGACARPLNRPDQTGTPSPATAEGPPTTMAGGSATPGGRL